MYSLRIFSSNIIKSKTKHYLKGLLFSSNDCIRNVTDLVRLWLHEALRVYGDKLVDDKVGEKFKSYHGI